MRRSLAVLTVVAGLAVSACSPAKPVATGLPSTPAPTTTSATTTTSAAPTHDAASTDLASVMRLVGTKSSRAGSARVTMNISVPGASAITAQGVVQWKGSLAADLTIGLPIQGQQASMRELLTKDAIYFKFGGALGAQSPTPWLKMSFADVAHLSGFDLSKLMQQAQQADPSSSLKTLAAAGKITLVGPDTVGGAPATHYKGVIDMSKLSTAEGVDPKLAQALLKAGVKQASYDLWINADQFPVKMVEVEQVNGKTVVVTLGYSDFGVPVSLKLPPASQVTDIGKSLPKA